MEIGTVTTIISLAFLLNYSSTTNLTWHDIGPLRLANGCFFDEGRKIIEIPSTREGCGNLCLASHLCVHFTWIDDRNGNQICWIREEKLAFQVHTLEKKAIPTNFSTVCGFLQSSWNEPESIPGFSWSYNCDFWGRDYKNRPCQNLKQCGELCLSDWPNCTHFTWSMHKKKTCFMKMGGASRGDEFIVPQASCGIVENTHQPSGNGIYRLKDCDFEGTSLQTLTNVNRYQCGSACQNTGKCVSFVWIPLNGTCYLKSGTATPKMAKNNTFGPDSVCGYVFIAWTNTSQTDAWAYDCDFPTETLKTQHTDERQCAQLCKDDSQCNHYTFNKHIEGGLCLMKYRRDITRNDAIRLVPQSSGIQSVCGLYETKNQEECDCECP